MDKAPFELDEPVDAQCIECGSQFKRTVKGQRLCIHCQNEAEAKGMEKTEPPEGGWPKGSDMDRL